MLGVWTRTWTDSARANWVCLDPWFQSHSAFSLKLVCNFLYQSCFIHLILNVSLGLFQLYAPRYNILFYPAMLQSRVKKNLFNTIQFIVPHFSHFSPCILFLTSVLLVPGLFGTSLSDCPLFYTIFSPKNS